jgi:hypothetical protein
MGILTYLTDEFLGDGDRNIDMAIPLAACRNPLNYFLFLEAQHLYFKRKEKLQPQTKLERDYLRFQAINMVFGNYDPNLPKYRRLERHIKKHGHL